ncbi:hypothetical protein AXF42_Ash007979 [Apostasia shenzhenica]|uniref:Uncharacterized protein n=1 Tax=Apostasia shenzhenica TaxID=1088818 RepID=A0A2I0B5V5_9ASPA|nr:hypothetical protein AXF42_Ash007979 [Apostasia shenzhenica]
MAPPYNPSPNLVSPLPPPPRPPTPSPPSIPPIPPIPCGPPITLQLENAHLLLSPPQAQGSSSSNLGQVEAHPDSPHHGPPPPFKPPPCNTPPQNLPQPLESIGLSQAQSSLSPSPPPPPPRPSPLKTFGPFLEIPPRPSLSSPKGPSKALQDEIASLPPSPPSHLSSDGPPPAHWIHLQAQDPHPSPHPALSKDKATSEKDHSFFFLMKKSKEDIRIIEDLPTALSTGIHSSTPSMSISIPEEPQYIG